ncbi:hypothetical protein ACOQFO_11515 [Ureibacillus sp. MALMAid1270]|uniref:hypothetical protein n=1 Tax=Ureibacillus sp. MALMAid1270 TaxID=3411629 RepID=UPI003BA44CD2
MKIYWFLVICFYFAWFLLSHQYPEPSWWSIFTTERSTHTPLIEHISYIKVTFTALIFIGLVYILHRTLQNRI